MPPLAEGGQGGDWGGILRQAVQGAPPGCLSCGSPPALDGYSLIIMESLCLEMGCS